MSGREKRKRRRRARPPAAPVTGARDGAREEASEEQARAATGRGKSRDDLARERLEPLAEGEVPGAVKVAAVVAAVLAVSNLAIYAAGVEVGDSEPSALGAISFALLMGVAAAGMWYGRYWAVLGFQAILAISIVSTFLFLIVGADSVLSALAAAVILAGSGTLFWLLVKSLARIQMPDRRTPES